MMWLFGWEESSGYARCPTRSPMDDDIYKTKAREMNTKNKMKKE